MCSSCCQVSLPHYKDIKFLTQGFQNYKQLLLLKQMDPEMIIVPGYDSDLLWHAHMAFPVQYEKDTQTLLGSILIHNDKLNDRTPGGALDVHDKKTSKMWESIYGERRLVPGGCFRGDPPEALQEFCPKRVDPDCICFSRLIFASKKVTISLPKVVEWCNISNSVGNHDFEAKVR